MPFMYSVAPGGNVATNVTPNTETDHLRLLTSATRNLALTGVYLIGKGAALTAISGIVARFYRYATPSTVGAAIVPRPRETGAPAMLSSAATAPTAGATPTLQLAIGCGAAGPGGWVSRDYDSMVHMTAGSTGTGNLDLLSASGTASLNFEYTLELLE